MLSCAENFISAMCDNAIELYYNLIEEKTGVEVTYDIPYDYTFYSPNPTGYSPIIQFKCYVDRLDNNTTEKIEGVARPYGVTVDNCEVVR